ncbi:hypothetical protein PCASD_17943 [Puccinia coronata f. sp. avenae]|uniref:Uncharacterized protein n=1 Tax=Puccinia coronata f. sp. avenae TaxID=200324 RepID=A0A2N5U401_9BASI|nr:hypothetical protein PCASD_17943 [Puccinia coronata f. sp. avenae]
MHSILEEVPSRAGHSPLRDLLASNIHCSSVEQVNTCPPTGGETATCHFAQGSPSSFNGRVYDANTNSPLSPQKQASQGQRRVGSSYALQPASSPRQRDVRGHRDASKRQADHNVQHFPGPMAPVCERKGSQQLLSNEESLESGHLNPRYHHQPLWYAKDDGDIQRLVSQRQAGKDGTIVPNPSPTATRASYQKEAPSHGGHNCGETAFCFPGLYATGRPSSASANSTATVTPLRAAAAASSQRAQSPAPWQGNDGSASSTRADDTRYLTPARHLPTRPESLPYPEQEGYYVQEQYYHQQQPLPPAHHLYAQYPPNGSQSNPPYSRNCCRSDPLTRMLQVGNFFMCAERVMNRMQHHRNRGRRKNKMPPRSASPRKP